MAPLVEQEQTESTLEQKRRAFWDAADEAIADREHVEPQHLKNMVSYTMHHSVEDALTLGKKLTTSFANVTEASREQMLFHSGYLGFLRPNLLKKLEGKLPEHFGYPDISYAIAEGAESIQHAKTLGSDPSSSAHFQQAIEAFIEDGTFTATDLFNKANDYYAELLKQRTAQELIEAERKFHEEREVKKALPPAEKGKEGKRSAYDMGRECLERMFESAVPHYPTHEVRNQILLPLATQNELVRDILLEEAEPLYKELFKDVEVARAAFDQDVDNGDSTLLRDALLQIPRVLTVMARPLTGNKRENELTKALDVLKYGRRLSENGLKLIIQGIRDTIPDTFQQPDDQIIDSIKHLRFRDTWYVDQIKRVGVKTLVKGMNEQIKQAGMVLEKQEDGTYDIVGLDTNGSEEKEGENEPFQELESVEMEDRAEAISQFIAPDGEIFFLNSPGPFEFIGLRSVKSGKETSFAADPRYPVGGYQDCTKHFPEEANVEFYYSDKRKTIVLKIPFLDTNGYRKIRTSVFDAETLEPRITDSTGGVLPFNGDNFIIDDEPSEDTDILNVRLVDSNYTSDTTTRSNLTLTGDDRFLLVDDAHISGISDVEGSVGYGYSRKNQSLLIFPIDKGPYQEISFNVPPGKKLGKIDFREGKAECWGFVYLEGEDTPHRYIHVDKQKLESGDQGAITSEEIVRKGTRHFLTDNVTKSPLGFTTTYPDEPGELHLRLSKFNSLFVDESQNAAYPSVVQVATPDGTKEVIFRKMGITKIADTWSIRSRADMLVTFDMYNIKAALRHPTRGLQVLVDDRAPKCQLLNKDGSEAMTQEEIDALMEPGDTIEDIFFLNGEPTLTIRSRDKKKLTYYAYNRTEESDNTQQTDKNLDWAKDVTAYDLKLVNSIQTFPRTDRTKQAAWAEQLVKEWSTPDPRYTFSGAKDAARSDLTENKRRRKQLAEKINKHIAEAPAQTDLLRHMPATPDKPTDYQVNQILEFIYGDTFRWESAVPNYGHGFSGKQETVDYFADKTQHDFIGGDPRENRSEGEPLMELREPLPPGRVLIRGISGSYDEERVSGKWRDVELKNTQPDLRNPVQVYTQRIPISRDGTINLPVITGARLLSDRISLVKQDGSLTPVEPSGTEGSLTTSVAIPAEDDIVAVQFSQEVSSLPQNIRPIDQKNYAKFLSELQHEGLAELSKPLINNIPPHALNFLTTIRRLAPAQRVLAVQGYMGTHAFYDMDDREVSRRKHGMTPSEQVSFMQRRADELRSRGVASDDHIAAGICEDHAILMTSMLRASGIAAGITNCLAPQEDRKTITDRDGHTNCAVLWPSDAGHGYEVLTLDAVSTAGVADADVQTFMQAELNEESQKLMDEYMKEHADRFHEETEEFLEMLRQTPSTTMKNGALERRLNYMLARHLTGKDMTAFEETFGLLYAGFDAADLVHNPRRRQEFIETAQGEVAYRDDKGTAEQKKLHGKDVFELFQRTVKQLEKESESKHDAASLLQEIVSRVYVGNSPTAVMRREAANALLQYLYKSQS